MNRVLSEKKINEYRDWLFDSCHNEMKERELQVLNLRNWFESFYEDICSSFKEAFPNLYSKFLYANEYYKLDKDLQANLNGIRIFLNKVIHNEIKDYTASRIKSCCFYFYNLLVFFSKKSDSVLETEFARFTPESFSKLKKIKHPQVASLSLIVDSWSLVQQGDGYKSELIGYEFDSDSQIKVLIWDIKDSVNIKDSFLYGKKIGNIAKLLWKGCKLTIYNVKQNADDEKVYFSQSTSKIVLEADFLVDATTIAKCFQNNYAYHKIALFSLFDKINISIPIVTGNFVNLMLDQMIASKDFDFADSFKKCVHSSLLTSLSLGVKPLMNIMHQVHTNHYPNLLNLCQRVRDIQITTEPTFYAPEYGLFGRLDGMLEGETSDSNRMSIFELKSGSVPKYQVWINHAVQVHIYDMLLSAIYGEKRTGSSMIFYSQDRKGQLRNVAPAPYMEQHILMVRNCIVSELKKGAEGSIDFIKYVQDLDIDRIPKFSEDRVKSLKDVFSNISPLEKIYFNQYLSFLLRELWAIKTGEYTGKRGLENTRLGQSSLWNSTMIEKKANPKIITGLIFDSLEKESLKFLRNDKSKTLSLRQGDSVLIYLYSERIDSQVLKGTITFLDEKNLLVKPRNAEINRKLFQTKEGWVIESDSNDSSIYGLITCLTDFIKSSQRTRQLLLGKIKPESDSAFSYNDADDYLNPIITKALACKDYFLLQGPPGTGKTSSFLLKCLHFLYEKSKEKILVLAFTNRAIDEVCLKLNQTDMRYLRLGINHNDAINDLSKVSEENDKLQDIGKVMQDSRIYCSTLAYYHAHRQALHSIISFDTLFIDEASQLIEPELIGITNNFKRFILIGDQNQLPAISIQDEEFQKPSSPELKEIFIKNYRQSLFERLFHNAHVKKWTHAYHTLSHHFRMHKDIADLINVNYDNKLIPKQDRQLVDSFLLSYENSNIPICKDILRKSRCIFIDVADTSSSRVSLKEAKLVKSILQAIISCSGAGFNSDKVGVICNWRSQINLIQELTPNEIAKDITIDTVERFQGSERDVIIYSLTVNFHHQLQILQSLTSNRKVDRKLNVALSRSKEQIIILGNGNVLQTLPQYAELIEKIKRDYLFVRMNDIANL